MCQNFAVRNIQGQVPKNIYQASNFLPSDFLTIFPKLVLIQIQWKTANSAKTDIEVSLKKIHALTLRKYFKKYVVSRKSKALVSVTFKIIISYIFRENFLEMYQVSEKI